VTGDSKSGRVVPVWFSIRFRTSKRLVKRTVHQEAKIMHVFVNGVRLRFADCRHGVMPDAPEHALAIIRDFIQRH
jgi:hypothetical protein